MKTKQRKLEGQGGVFHRVRARKARSYQESPMKGNHHTEEAKQKNREAHLGKNHTEDSKQLMSEAHLGEKNHNHGKTKETDEGIRRGSEKSSKTRKEFFATEEGQKWLDEHMRRENAPNYGNHHTDEAKQKQREGNLGKIVSEATRQLISKANIGENNSMFGIGEKHPFFGKRGKDAPNYIDGRSNAPYCEKFDEDLKERVRNFFGRCCYVCGKNEIENGRKLDVHHVNFDKMVCCNDVKPLFVPLCKSCHSKTLKDREYWEEFFTVSLNYLTDGECFLPKKK